MKGKRNMKGNRFEYKMVNTANIISSPVYQRQLSASKVDQIVRNFDRNLVNPPKLSFRNGKYYVFDGQNTTLALKQVNGGQDLNILCKVFYGLTELDETELFLQQNGYSSPVHSNEKLRAMYNTGDLDVIEMVRACESIGVEVDFLPRSKGANRIQAVKTLYNIYMQVGADGLKSELSIIKEAWNGTPYSLSREMLAGMNLFCVTYAGEYQRKRLVDKLKKVDPVTILREAKSITPKSAVGTARVLLRTYNMNATSKTYIEGRI